MFYNRMEFREALVDLIRVSPQKKGVGLVKTYVAIDLKSFYASVECVERGLDPMTTHLVVADPSRECPAPGQQPGPGLYRSSP